MADTHRAPRVPLAILGAVALLSFAVAGFLVLTVQAFAGGHWWGLFPVAIGFVEALIAVGLWRGNRAAYIAAIVLGALWLTSSFSYVDDVVAFALRFGEGGLLLALLLVPASARRHVVPAQVRGSGPAQPSPS